MPSAFWSVPSSGCVSRFIHSRCVCPSAPVYRRVMSMLAEGTSLHSDSGARVGNYRRCDRGQLFWHTRGPLHGPADGLIEEALGHHVLWVVQVATVDQQRVAHRLTDLV